MSRFTIVQPESEIEAMGYLASALYFFLKKHPKKTIVMVILLFGGAGYVLNDYLNSYQVNVERAKPMKPISAEFRLMPQLYAGEQEGDSILIDGKFYGYEDTNYVIKKFQGRDVLFVYIEDLNYAYKVDAPFLGIEKLRSIKKQKR